MRWRKAVITLLLAFALSVAALLLGWSIANDNRSDIAVYSLHVVFALYVSLVSAGSVGQNVADLHSESILHLTVLLTIAFTLLGSTAILPETPSIVSTSSQLKSLWYALVGLYTVACGVVFTTPLGPPLHYPASDIYSEKTVEAITNTDEANVCGVIGTYCTKRSCSHPNQVPSDASPWDTLLFSYTTKVVWLGNIAESLDIGDLPIVPANIRATYNYARMRRAMRDIRLRIFSWKPTPGNGWNLAYCLLRLNQRVFFAEFLLAAASAVLFYSPPLFLQKLVAFLEADPTRENKGWGWVYVIGLFSTHVIVFLSKFRAYWNDCLCLNHLLSHRSAVVVVHHHYSSTTAHSAEHHPVCEDSRS